MSRLNEIRKHAKEMGIPWREVLEAKRAVQELHEQRQELIDDVRQTAFRKLTGRRDHMWFIFGYETDRGYGKWFREGDYSEIPNWDTVARSVFFECPGMCRFEDDASEAMWDFIKNEPFKIPCNERLYNEAFQMLTASLAAVPF